MPFIANRASSSEGVEFAGIVSFATPRREKVCGNAPVLFTTKVTVDPSTALSPCGTNAGASVAVTLSTTAPLPPGPDRSCA